MDYINNFISACESMRIDDTEASNEDGNRLNKIQENLKTSVNQYDFEKAAQILTNTLGASKIESDKNNKDFKYYRELFFIRYLDSLFKRQDVPALLIENRLKFLKHISLFELIEELSSDRWSKDIENILSNASIFLDDENDVHDKNTIYDIGNTVYNSNVFNRINQDIDQQLRIRILTTLDRIDNTTTNDNEDLDEENYDEMI